MRLLRVVGKESRLPEGGLEPPCTERVRLGAAAGILGSMWFFVDEPWQYRVLDPIPSGIDVAQIECARRMTLAERLDAVTELVDFGEQLRQGLAKQAGK